MKKVLSILSFFIFCIVMLSATTPKQMYVSIQKASLREKPSALSKVIQTLSYGDAVTVIEEKGKWIKISPASKDAIIGWVEKSALTKKKIFVNGNKVSANAKELALAGKGFNAEVESSFKTSGQVNYAPVDEMEKNIVSQSQMEEFIEEGNLNGGEE